MKRHIGERFGRLVLQEHLGGKSWVVKCDCGKEKSIDNIDNIARGTTNSCGCLKEEVKRLDLTNKTFGNLKCLNLAYIKNGLTYWEFLCLKCNSKYICQGRCVTRAKNPNTKCRQCSYLERDSGFNGCGEIGGSYLCCIRNGARKRKLEYEVGATYLWELFLSQDKKCALSGIPITLDKNYRKRDGQTASLDRINSSVGYIEGNVQWVHKDINRIKLDYDESYFIYLCECVTFKNKELK